MVKGIIARMKKYKDTKKLGQDEYLRRYSKMKYHMYYVYERVMKW